MLRENFPPTRRALDLADDRLQPRLEAKGRLAGDDVVVPRESVCPDAAAVQPGAVRGAQVADKEYAAPLEDCKMFAGDPIVVRDVRPRDFASAHDERLGVEPPVLDGGFVGQDLVEKWHGGLLVLFLSKGRPNVTEFFENRSGVMDGG
jgi:hypothetical protein